MPRLETPHFQTGTRLAVESGHGLTCTKIREIPGLFQIDNLVTNLEKFWVCCN